MLVSKIAFTIFIVSWLTAFVSAQFATPFPQIIDTPKVITAIAAVIMLVSFVVGAVSVVWGV